MKEHGTFIDLNIINKIQSSISSIEHFHGEYHKEVKSKFGRERAIHDLPKHDYKMVLLGKKLGMDPIIAKVVMNNFLNDILRVDDDNEIIIALKNFAIGSRFVHDEEIAKEQREFDKYTRSIINQNESAVKFNANLEREYNNMINNKSRRYKEASDVFRARVNAIARSMNAALEWANYNPNMLHEYDKKMFNIFYKHKYIFKHNNKFYCNMNLFNVITSNEMKKMLDEMR